MKYNEIRRGCLGKSTLMSALGDLLWSLPQERLDLWDCCMATLSDDKLQMTLVIWEEQKDTRTRHSSFKCGAPERQTWKAAPVSCKWHWHHTSQHETPTGYTLGTWITKLPFLHEFLGHDMANGPSRLPLLLGVRVGWEAQWRRASRRGRQGLGRGPGLQQLGRLPVDSCAAYKWSHDPHQVDSQW